MTGMGHRPWGWSPEGRRRWAMLVVWFAHLFWVILGRGTGGHWQTALGLFSRPGQVAARHWDLWRTARSQKTGNLKQAQAELEALRWQVQGLRGAAMSDAARVAEADSAVRLLGLKQQLPLEMKAARIIVNVRKAPFGGMVLDAGLDEGLVQDQGLICPEGVVGRLWQVSNHQASVLPLDAYNASTAVMLGRSRATGVLQGVGPGKAEIRYIGVQEVVQPGEPVLTSGLDRVFPRGLLVGYVSAIKPRDTELGIQVALAAPLDRVDLVLILPPRPEIELKPPAEPPAPSKGKRGAK